MFEQASRAHPTPDRRWVVMGVSGCGKTEISRRLAARLGATSIEGDEFHSPECIEKMRAGVPLNDDDRQAWLLTLQQRIMLARERGESAVLSCSALKRRYRDILRAGDPNMTFVHLDGERAIIEQRMRTRDGHYMPLSLLDSQIAALECLQDDEAGARFDLAMPPEHLVEKILALLG